MTNNYESADVIELGNARNEILSQKVIDINIDNFGIAWYSDAPTLDDFDE